MKIPDANQQTMKTLRICFIMSIMLGWAINISGQAGNSRSIADDYFNNKKFSEALTYYLNLLKKDPTNGQLNYRAAECYKNSRSQKINAIPHLEKAINAVLEKPDSSYSLFDVYESLGDVYRQLYKFDNAISNYEKCKVILNSINAQKDKIEELDGKIDICKIGKVLNGLGMPTDPKGEKDNKNISLNNSPSLSQDRSTITFTFKRSGNVWNEDNDSRYFEKTTLQKPDSVISRKVALTPDKKKNRYEATIATSVDGQIVLTYRDEDGSASLYTSCLTGNHWTLPEKLNTITNLAGWEPSEYVSADGATMYFISDRKGGYGGKDIYVCKKMENGEWGKAVNMGPAINTPYDEEAPFVHPDGKTFYFSSNGFNKEGNFEILGCQLSEKIIPSGISKIGFPIDTTNDAREVVRSKRPVSDEPPSRKRNKNKVDQVDNRTNYLISFINPNGIPLTLVKGSIIDRTGSYNGSLVIEVKNNLNGRVTACYLTEPSAQEFAFILPPSMNNNISFQKRGFFIQSMNLNTSDNKDNYKRLDPIVLLPIEKDAKIVLNNVFFETGSSAISAVSKAELNDRANFMKENPEVSFEILGVAECGSNVRENSKLCSARADELVRYFIDKGVEKDRLNAKGYALRLKGSDPQTFDQRIELRIIEDELPKNKSLTTKEKIGKGK